MISDTRWLRNFNVILAGCDFSSDGTAKNPSLLALRAMSADPNIPPIILVSDGGGEYTAVQSIKSGAFDYIPKTLLGKEQVISAVQRALLAHGAVSDDLAVTGVVRLFGYDIRRCLASNDNISVHVAFSAERSKEVVIKVLHRGRGALSRDTNFERFIDEFKMLYDIDDPAVAEIYDFRVTDQYCYIAMEYFSEGHLGRKLTSALPPADALGITVEIAHALSIIHTAGVIHRDLKPGNIMLRTDGTAALIDFGISQSRVPEQTDLFEQQALVAGTPYYISPEQARGDATNERTDLYALGVMFYQMLVGEKPYVGDDAKQILAQHCEPSIPQLPDHLAKYQPLLDRMMAKDLEERISSARELTELLEEKRLTATAGYKVSAGSG